MIMSNHRWIASLSTALALAACGPLTDSIDTDAGADSAVADVPRQHAADAAPGEDASDSAAEDVAQPDVIIEDPCRGVSAAGRCASDSMVERCAMGEHIAPQLVSERCDSTERCMLVEGAAHCVETRCTAGATRCRDDRTLERCGAAGWSAESCANGCVGSDERASCAPAMTPDRISGRVIYEARAANSGRTAWGPTVNRPARGFLVTLERDGAVLASTTSSAMDGTFSLPRPAAIERGDRVVVSAVRRSGSTTDLALVNPQLSPGAYTDRLGAVASVSRATVWRWTWLVDTLTGPSPTLEITIARNSAAANVFDRVAWGTRFSRAHYGRAGRTMIVWMGPGVDWTNSFVGAETRVAIPTRTTFQSQMFYAMDREQSYWADSVILHETGHWMMGSYSESNSETSGHTYRCETWPGLAWKEGFANYFAQIVLGNPFYTAVNSSSVYAYDISGEDPDRRWPHASPTAADIVSSRTPGLFQKLSELEVSMILWRLSDGSRDPGPVLDALGSARMNRPDPATGRFERGYFQRYLGAFDSTRCSYSSVTATSRSIPVLPDFLDALNCAGFSRARITSAVRPNTRYPYPVDRPLCR